MKKPIKRSYVREKAGQGTDISVCALSGCCFHEQLALRANFRNYSMGVSKCQWIFVQQKISKEVVRTPQLGQHRTIPALRLKHRSGSCGTASALPKCSIMSGCGTRIVLRGQKPLALCDRCPCFGSLFPPLAALTFAASSIICAFGLASAAPRSPYRHLELCGIAIENGLSPAEEPGCCPAGLRNVPAGVATVPKHEFICLFLVFVRYYKQQRLPLRQHRTIPA